MSTVDRAEQIERLTLDVDTRLIDLWRQTADVGEWSLEAVAAFFRWAYVRGYEAALTEPHGKLYRENGYRVPGRRSAD